MGAAAIEHNNIVLIFQVGEERGVPFIAMPFLKALDARLSPDEALPAKETIRIGRETALGLAAAYELPLEMFLVHPHPPRGQLAGIQGFDEGKRSPVRHHAADDVKRLANRYHGEPIGGLL